MSLVTLESKAFDATTVSFVHHRACHTAHGQPDVLEAGVALLHPLLEPLDAHTTQRQKLQVHLKDDVLGEESMSMPLATRSMMALVR